jgi:hypothetical protein
VCTAVSYRAYLQVKAPKWISVEWGSKAWQHSNPLWSLKTSLLLQPQENGHSHHSAQHGGTPAELQAAPKHMPWETVYDGKDASAKVAVMTSPVLRMLGSSECLWHSKS